MDALAFETFKRESWRVARAVARRASAGSRAYAGWVLPLAFLGFVTAWVTIYTPYNNGPPIRSDGTGYHVWTRALLDRDVSFCRWRDAIENFLAVKDDARNFCQNKYPPGLALLRFPVMAFLVDRSDPNDVHVTRAEHNASLILGGGVLWLQAAFVLWAAALLQLPAWRSSAAVLFAVFGTGSFHYATYDGSFSHVYSAFLYASLLLLAVREHVTGRRMSVVLLGVCSFFLASLRNTNALLLAELTLAYLIWRRSVPWSRLVLQKLVPVAIGASCAIALQWTYNYIAVGGLAVSSYGEERFIWDRPMQHAVLFSYERGLFTYYPVFGLGLLTGLAIRRARPLTLVLSALIATLTTLYGYWHMWPLGAGMGHRGFVEIVPLLALVMCLAFGGMRRLELYPVLTVGVVFSAVTVQIMYGYWFNTFKGAEETKENYWRHMHTLESFATGGTMCKPSRCDIWQWKCQPEPVPQYSFCIEGFRHSGVCVDGRCAPVVALRWNAAGEHPYISAPPPRKGNFQDVVVAAAKIGDWERFALIDDPGQPRGVRLMSLHTKLYVSAPQVDDDPKPLVSGPSEPREHELFVRRRTGTRVYLKAWNGRFVTPVPWKPDRFQLRASAERATKTEAFELVYVRTQW